jgi:hypothetical protein
LGIMRVNRAGAMARTLEIRRAEGDSIMVKVILGSAVGGLVAGGIALLAGSQAPSTVTRGSYAEPTMMPVGQTVAQSASPTVQCAPHQQATLARVVVQGQEMTTLACVDRANDGIAYYQPAPQAFAAPQGYAQPVSYVPVQAPLPAPQVSTAVRRPAATRTVYRDREDTVRYEPDTRKRSIAKTAMIIGGSAGAGAGVGAIAGGKKGALIGAAIGGGAASIYEATKR